MIICLKNLKESSDQKITSYKIYSLKSRPFLNAKILVRYVTYINTPHTLPKKKTKGDKKKIK